MERCKYGCESEPQYTQKKFSNGTFHYCRQCPECGTIIPTNGKFWLPSNEIDAAIDAGAITFVPFIGEGAV